MDGGIGALYEVMIVWLKEFLLMFWYCCACLCSGFLCFYGAICFFKQGFINFF
jgi:hypothetical protein